MTNATARLITALITMAQRGERPRCADPITHEMWTSDDQQERAIAALWCTRCVLLELGDYLSRAAGFTRRWSTTINEGPQPSRD